MPCCGDAGCLARDGANSLVLVLLRVLFVKLMTVAVDHDFVSHCQRCCDVRLQHHMLSPEAPLQFRSVSFGAYTVDPRISGTATLSTTLGVFEL